jgi:hypothetical protein
LKSAGGTQQTQRKEDGLRTLHSEREDIFQEI